MNSFTTAQRIEACEVPAGERLQVLPRHFGRSVITVESAIYSFMQTLAHQYSDGCSDSPLRQLILNTVPQPPWLTQYAPPKLVVP
jgi:hypothetical protein